MPSPNRNTPIPEIPCSAFNGDECRNHPEEEADAEADKQSQPYIVGLEHGVVAAERTEQHDAVDPEVEHAAALPVCLAEAGQEQRHREPDRRGDGGNEDGFGEELTHGSPPPGAGPAGGTALAPALARASRRASWSRSLCR